MPQPAPELTAKQKAALEQLRAAGKPVEVRQLARIARCGPGPVEALVVKGYATRALALLLPEARQEGLPYVELTTDATNDASQRVIVANGGTLVEHFRKPAVYGGAESLRFRIPLTAGATA